MLVRLPILFVTIICATELAYAQKGGFDVKGVVAGGTATPSDVSAAFGIKCSASAPTTVFAGGYICNGLTSIAGASADANIVLLSDGYVARMYFRLSNWQWDDIKTALIEKYGRPASSRNLAKINGFGARFAAQELTWRRGSVTLSAESHANSKDATVSFRTKRDEQLLNEVRKRRRSGDL